MAAASARSESLIGNLSFGQEISVTEPKLPRRVVFITGATSGIGRACAEHLASRGWRVFGAGRRASASTTISGIEMLPIDVDDAVSVRACVDAVLDKAGRLDAVINNAGFSTRGAVEDTAIEDAKAQFETNFFGILRVCQAVLPALRAGGGGHIVNISSLAGLVGVPFTGLYSASKFALEGVSESLRTRDAPIRHTCRNRRTRRLSIGNQRQTSYLHVEGQRLSDRV